jgi:hypothetical protein
MGVQRNRVHLSRTTVKHLGFDADEAKTASTIVCLNLTFNVVLMEKEDDVFVTRIVERPFFRSAGFKSVRQPLRY